MLHSYVLYWKMMFLKSILLFCIEKWGFQKTLLWKNYILMCYIEKWCFRSQFFCFVLKNEEWEFLNTLSEKNVTFLCIILKNEVFEINSFVLYWKMIISKNSFPKMLYSYVLYWKMMFLKSNLMFCFKKWGMRISKNTFRKKFAFLCIILKNESLKSILLFYIEKWEFLRTLFRKMLYSYVLYWKMMFWSKILCFCIEKWGMRISKKTLSEKKLHSYVLYWKMMFLKSILLFCIEKWGFPKKHFREKILFLCIILKNDVFEVNSFVLYWKMRNENFLNLFPKKCYILMYYIEKWGFWDYSLLRFKKASLFWAF